MKRNYVKPEIMFENFTMSTNIAAGCNFISKLQGKVDACGYMDDRGNGPIFTSDVNGCTYTQPDGYDSICYHVPNENYDIFTS